MLIYFGLNKSRFGLMLINFGLNKSRFGLMLINFGLNKSHFGLMLFNLEFNIVIKSKNLRGFENLAGLNAITITAINKVLMVTMIRID
jgi:hypothetical protein